MVFSNSEKLPLRMRGVGTVVVTLGAAKTMRLASASPKKKSLSLMMGKPRVAPNWFWRYLGTLVVEVLAHVEGVVADVLPGAAVDSIGAGFDAGVDDRAGGVAELRAVGSGLDLELSESVRWRPDDVAGAVEEVDDVGVVVDAVEDEVVLLGALAVGVEVAFTLRRARHWAERRLR